MEARVLAVKVLSQVLGHRHALDKTLAQQLPLLKEPNGHALVQELCYGVVRWQVRLEGLVTQLVNTPLKDEAVHYLLLLGLYQLMYMRIPPHAAVDSTVNAATALKKPWAKGLVNAVLRRYLRDCARLTEQLERADTTRYAHPAWLLEALQRDWPTQWTAIAAANNERPPLALRVNARKVTRAAYLEQLAAAGIEARALPHTDHGIVIDKPLPVEGLPGFAEGAVSVQDGAAQQAAPLLDVQPGQRVLDACAAPGGKTCHILELQPEVAELVAVDQDPTRLTRIQQNLTRLQVNAKLVAGDARHPERWWDSVPFDRILLDAPCSALGVIRRHPDIKYLRSAADISAVAQVQYQLLSKLWPVLKSGGMLLYVTCSVLKQENEQPVKRFLTEQADARSATVPFPWQDRPHSELGAQILPGEQGMDGFYYACLYKR